MSRRDLRALEQPLQDISDARPAQTFASDAKEQRFVFAAYASLGEPRPNRLKSAGPEGAGALLAALADDHKVRNRIDSDVGDVEVDEFLDAQASVVQREQQCPVSEASTRVRGFDDVGYLVFVEVAHLDMLGTSKRQLTDPSASLQMLGGDRCDVSSECLDCGESVIASSGTASALAFQELQERPYDRDIQYGVIKLLGAATQTSARETEEELERVAVREHGVAARVALGGQVVLEESLHQRLQRVRR